MTRHHAIDYIEFPANDLEKVKQFYSAAFDWQFTDYGPEYTAFTDGTMEGGFTQGSVAKASGPLVILYSDDLEGSLALVKHHAGIISKPIFDFPGGRRFHFLDPAGNELAVWSDQ